MKEWIFHEYDPCYESLFFLYVWKFWGILENKGYYCNILSGKASSWEKEKTTWV